MKVLSIKMPDSSVWAVPVLVIAMHRAAVYAYEFDGSVERSLAEDTNPYFEDDPYNIEDWAANNMNWSDVKDNALFISVPETDFQEGWVNGEKEVIEYESPSVGSANSTGVGVGISEISPEQADIHIKQANLKLLAEKIINLDENPDLTQEQVNALGLEVVELARGILANSADPHEKPTI